MKASKQVVVLSRNCFVERAGLPDDVDLLDRADVDAARLLVLRDQLVTISMVDRGRVPAAALRGEGSEARAELEDPHLPRDRGQDLLFTVQNLDCTGALTTRRPVSHARPPWCSLGRPERRERMARPGKLCHSGGSRMR